MCPALCVDLFHALQTYNLFGETKAKSVIKGKPIMSSKCHENREGIKSERYTNKHVCANVSSHLTSLLLYHMLEGLQWKTLGRRTLFLCSHHFSVDLNKPMSLVLLFFYLFHILWRLSCLQPDH